MRAAIAEVTGRPNRGVDRTPAYPPASFVPGQALALEISADRGNSARLYYRARDSGRKRGCRWRWSGADQRYRSAIPAGYTASPYPLQYYFECKDGPEKAWLHPGFAADLANQPYFIVRAKAS